YRIPVFGMAQASNDDLSRRLLLKRSLEHTVDAVDKGMIIGFRQRWFSFRRHLSGLDLIKDLQPQLAILDHTRLLTIVVDVDITLWIAGVVTTDTSGFEQRTNVAFIGHQRILRTRERRRDQQKKQKNEGRSSWRHIGKGIS